jgi:hypothetical protein
MSDQLFAPPVWAEALVRLLASARDRDTIAGDLHEEYAERAAGRGTPAADWWYAGQVLGFVRRAALLPGLALGLNLCRRMLIDLVTPLDDLAARAATTTYLAILIFALAGFRISYRTHRTASAALVAVVATAIGTVMQMAMAFLATLAAGSWLTADYLTLRALQEGFDVPVIPLLGIGVLAAALGGASARACSPRARRAHAGRCGCDRAAPPLHDPRAANVGGRFQGDHDTVAPGGDAGERRPARQADRRLLGILGDRPEPRCRVDQPVVDFPHDRRLAGEMCRHAGCRHGRPRAE